jgi:hypothetical protein
MDLKPVLYYEEENKGSEEVRARGVEDTVQDFAYTCFRFSDGGKSKS